MKNTNFGYVVFKSHTQNQSESLVTQSGSKLKRT